MSTTRPSACGLTECEGRAMCPTCTVLAATEAPAPTMNRWIERWHGSGPERGWSIWELTTSTHGDRVAYVGEGEHSERLTALIVQKHNDSLAAAPEAPALPAEVREALKVAREALGKVDTACRLIPEDLEGYLEPLSDALSDARAAIARIDALGGVE